MPFSSLFLTAKNVEVRARRRLSLSQTQGKSQLGARRRLNMVKKGAEERTKTFWFRNRWLFGPRNLQSALNEMFFLPLFLVLFFFFFVARLPVGENTSLLPCGSNTSFAQGASGKRGPNLLHCSKEGTVYPRKTMRQLRKVCHAEGVLCLSSWQQSWTSPADEALLERCWSGRLPQPGKAKSLLFVKHDKRTDKDTNHNDCTSSF